MTIKELVEDLRSNIYVRVGVSKISGIGVIAIRDIPKGTDPFKSTEEYEYVGIPEEDIFGLGVPKLDPNVERYMRDMCVFDEGKWWLPSTGLNSLSVGWYLNHSTTPNMEATDKGELFISTRDILSGEELTVDYMTYDRSGSEQDFSS
jgi:hypothetical protein